MNPISNAIHDILEKSKNAFETELKSDDFKTFHTTMRILKIAKITIEQIALFDDVCEYQGEHSYTADLAVGEIEKMIRKLEEIWG